MKALKLSLLKQGLTIIEDQISKEATNLSFAFTMDEREIHKANLQKLREDRKRYLTRIEAIENNLEPC